MSHSHEFVFYIGNIAVYAKPEKCNPFINWEIFSCIPLLFWTLAYTGRTKRHLGIYTLFNFMLSFTWTELAWEWSHVQDVMLIQSPKAEISEWA